MIEKRRYKIFKYRVKDVVNALLGVYLLFSYGVSFADDNPFPNIDIGNGDVISTGGSYMEKAFKYTLIGVGGLLIMIGIAVIVQRLRDDSRERDHGNLVMTFILVALAITFGFVLIAIGWKAFSANIS